MSTSQNPITDLVEKISRLKREREFEKALELLPDSFLNTENSPTLFAEKAELYEELRKYGEAELNVEKALAIEPSNYKALSIKGNLKFNRKLFQEASDLCIKAIAANPRYPYPYLTLAAIADRHYIADESQRYLRKFIQLAPQIPDGYCALAVRFFNDHKYDVAKMYFLRALNINKNFPAALAGMGFVCNKSRDFQASEEFWHSAIAIEPNAEYLFGFGQTYYEQEKFSLARELFVQAIEIDESDIEKHRFLASAYYHEGNKPKAVEAYIRVLKFNPKDFDANRHLGLLHDHWDRFAKSGAYFRKCLQINNMDADILNGLGNFYNHSKKYAMAVSYYSKALAIDPVYGPALYGSAEANFQRKRFEDSLSMFEKFLRKAKGFNLDAELRCHKRIEECKDQVFIGYFTIREHIGKIKKCLLFEGNCITHFTSVTTAHNLILRESHLRLSEGAYLNDPSEGNIVNKLFPEIQSILEQHSNEISQIGFSQKPFIGSFVPEAKNNELALWRMYGKENNEEAKGCSITMYKSVLIEDIRLVKSEFQKKRDQIRKSAQNGLNYTENNDVAYPEEDLGFYNVAYKDMNSVNFHVPGIDPILQGNLKAAISELISDVNIYIDRYKNSKDAIEYLRGLLNEIAYLFKTREYEYEAEVRLVVRGKSFEKTIDEVFSPPKIYLNIAKITRAIKQITLGPKVEKSEEWAAAFQYHLNKKEINSTANISKLLFK